MQHEFPVKEAANFLKCCFELYPQQTRRDCLRCVNSSNFFVCLFTDTAVLHRFKWLGLCQGISRLGFLILLLQCLDHNIFLCQASFSMWNVFGFFFIFFFLPNLAFLHCMLILACYCRLFRRAALSVFICYCYWYWPLWVVQINLLL